MLGVPRFNFFKKPLSGALTAFLQNVDAASGVVNPADAIAGIQLHTDGTVKKCETAVGFELYVTEFVWKTSGNLADFEIRVSGGSGSVAGSADNTWLSCDTIRTWTVSRLSAGESTASRTVEIRRVSDSVVVATATWTWTATVEL